MNFDPLAYGPQVAAILALDGNGTRVMPLAAGTCCSAEARGVIRSTTAAGLFPAASSPEAAMAGLWLYFSCLDESHRVSQQVPSIEGSFWHGIMHRQEPDAGNSAYWFRRVGNHPLFPALREQAERIVARHPGTRFQPGTQWDPFAFIDFCSDSRSTTSSADHRAALEIQRVEWQLLFDYCARRQSE
ncbi:MAG: hypothetical protein IT160_19040 [Bryobacterales bacterium]|nr:hypothetical protein [Bryobacterales bacterium]